MLYGQSTFGIEFLGYVFSTQWEKKSEVTEFTEN